MNADRTLVGATLRGDSTDLNDDVSMIAQLAFARANRGSARGGALPLMPRETLELDLTDPAQRIFGNYELLELIGEGGMGVVYRARQIGLDREVAVKLLAAGPWASSEFVERFHREAQNAARMQHPNIVAIYEVGDAEELQFFSMRLVRGDSLAVVLRRDGKLPALRAARLLRTIAEAVDYAHRLGVLHLDLKPANVLIDENGAPHVADFGLARRVDQDLAADNTEVSGTPSYMAPEQAIAGVQNITAATDIWGLGAVLYELVAGVPPFLGTSPHGTLRLVVEGTLENPRQHTPRLPLDLEAIILKCMSRKAADRYPSGRALADDLTRFIEGREVRARPLHAAQSIARWARREPRLALTGSVALAALLAGLAATTQQWQRADSNANRAAANAAVSNERLWESRRDKALELEESGRGFEALSPLLANIEEQERAGKTDLAGIERREIGMIMSQGVTLIARTIIADAKPLAAGLSPDGKTLAIALADQTVRWFDTPALTEAGRVDLSGLPTSNGEEIAPRMLRFAGNRRLIVTLDWDDYLAAPSNRDSYQIDLDRGIVMEPPAEFANLSDAVFSADGRHAALHDRNNQVQLWQVEPWRALSDKATKQEHLALPWLVGRDLRYAMSLPGGSYKDLLVYDPRKLGSPRNVMLPPATQPSAWEENNAGSVLALGDSAGRVLLVDTGNGSVRTLPTPLGLNVTALAFSEDDAWVAAVRRDGSAFAFDVATGNPLNSGQMQHDFDARQVWISHHERLLIASGLGETAIWRLPPPGPTGVEAHRIIASPTRSLRAGTNALGASLDTGLLATASMDGEVRLWRIPGAPTLPFGVPRSGTSIPDSLTYDGGHIADVEYRSLRVVSTTGQAPTAWVELPQPPAFAELLHDGKTLVATSGPALYVFDATSMQPRFAPVALPANPLHLAADPDGRFVILAFGHNATSGFEERLEVYDLATGRRGPAATVVGPLRQLALSPDSSRLLAAGPARGATEVYDVATMRLLGSYPHQPDRPTAWASFGAGNDPMWLIARDAEDAIADNADLIAWDPATGLERERRFLPGLFPVGITVVAGKPLLAARDQDLLDPGTSDARGSARLTRGETTSVFASSHDGRLIAHGLGRNVQLYEAATLTPVGPPLRSNCEAMDMPARLAFAPDDRHLLGNATTNWLLWPIATDARPVAEIRQDVDLLNPLAGGQHVLELPNPAQRQRLLSRDPGRLAAREQRPLPQTARSVGGAPIPARSPGTPETLLDLSGVYDAAPFTKRNLFATVMPVVDSLPFGMSRIDGVDYDLRGAVELRWLRGGGSEKGNVPWKVTGVHVPAIPIAAVHALLIAPHRTAVPEVRIYASLALHYRDGSVERVPIRTQIEVSGMSESDQVVPIAWTAYVVTRLIGILKQQPVHNPRLPNPHPERMIDSLDLEAAEDNWSEPVFLAITAEPVIGSGQSRSNDSEPAGAR